MAAAGSKTPGMSSGEGTGGNGAAVPGWCWARSPPGGGPPTAARADLAEQTPVGEALVRGLVRAQLALALRLSLVVVTGLGALPLLFAVAPAVGEVKVFGVNLPWLLLGVLSFPFLFVVGWAYVRWAERNEQDFTAVIRRPEQ